MMKLQPIPRRWLRLAIILGFLGLTASVIWVPESILTMRPSRSLVIVVGSFLAVAAVRHPRFGRVLGWSGLIAQAGMILL